MLSYLFSPSQNQLYDELERLNVLKLISIEPEKQNVLNEKIENHQHIDAEEKSLLIFPTQLGRAVLASSLSLNVAMQIFNDLEQAKKSLCLDSELHMLYLVV